jgi:putative PIN family toxin of toxin-antitoxin system
MHDVVVDTNVLVAALRSSRGASFQLIRRIGQGEFRMLISVALALEYEEVLKRREILPGFYEADIDAFLDYIFHVAHLIPSVISRRPHSRDPDDEFVVDLAAQREALILTYNKKDFREAEARSIRILSPAEFLWMLRQENAR